MHVNAPGARGQSRLVRHPSPLHTTGTRDICSAQRAVAALPSRCADTPHKPSITSPHKLNASPCLQLAAKMTTAIQASRLLRGSLPALYVLACAVGGPRQTQLVGVDAVVAPTVVTTAAAAAMAVMAARLMHHEASFSAASSAARVPRHHACILCVKIHLAKCSDKSMPQHLPWPSEAQACHSIRHRTSMPQHPPSHKHGTASAITQACHSIRRLPSMYDTSSSYGTASAARPPSTSVSYHLAQGPSVQRRQSPPVADALVLPCARCFHARSCVPAASKEASVDASSTASLAYCATVPAIWQQLKMTVWHMADI